MVIAAIPTLGESPLLRPLVDHLLGDTVVDEILLMVNQPGIHLPVEPDPRITVMETRGPSIYPGWNAALDYGRFACDYVAILNDDIVFDHPQVLSLAAALMREHPQLVVLGFNYRSAAETPLSPEIRYCRGTYRHGGIGGFAFLVDPQRCPEVDEDFEWWGADDDLFFQVEQKFGPRALAIANTLRVEHHSETTAQHHPWTVEARDRDRLRFEEKYGRGSAW